MTDNKKGDCATNTNCPSKTTNSSTDNNIVPLWEAISAFQNEISEAGLGSPEIKPTGTIVRFKAPDDKGRSKSGWYLMFTDGIYSGRFGSWKSGYSQNWHMKSNIKPLSPEEKRAFAIACKKVEQKRLDETNQKHRKAAKIAQSIWANASPCSPDAPYLVKKCISSCAKYLRQDKHKNILVPLFSDRQISSLQFISNKNLGAKWYLAGGKVSGAYFLFGDIKSKFKTAYVSEGLASAFSSHLLLARAPVFVAFTAYNLINISKLVRAQFKDIDLVIIADNDVRDKPNEINTGVVEAERAALGIIPNGRVSIPSLPSGEKCDFNDLYVKAIEVQEKEKGASND